MAIASNAAERKRPGRAGQFAKKLLVQAGTFISLAIVCGALWVVYRTLKKIELAEVLENVQALPWTSVFLALGITAASYVVVTGYDVVALNHINRPLPYRRAALAGFLANAFGSNLGFPMVTGGAIRYRLYSKGGLTAVEIAGITTMYALTVTLGIGFILTLSLLFGSAEATAFSLPLGVKRTLGAVMLGLMVVYLIVSAIRPMTIRTRHWSLRLPSAKTASAQIALGALDLMLIGSVIYVLLPVYPGNDFFGFLGVFALALLAGGVSHVPGGIGVFESVMLVGLPEIPPAALLGAILLFRCVYYLAPLGVAAIMLAAHEVVAQRAQWVRARESATDWLEVLGPQIMAVVIIFAGMMLLFSSAVPAPAGRLGLLRETAPLALVEVFHALAGAAGIGLVILARGLSLRLSRAYRLIAVLLALGIVAFFLKGLIYEGAFILALTLLVLLATHREFRRGGSLLDQGFPAEWVSTVMAILAVTIWLGIFSYKQFAYSHGLWWQFQYEAELSRCLRTLAVAVVLAGATALAYLLRADPVPDLPHTASVEQIRSVVKQDPNARANLALLGDKRFLFSPSGQAFIMYRVMHKSWVALGDPVGPRAEHENLLWTFRDLCDRYGGWPVFYLIDAESLSRYIDLGLSVLKLGDDARIPLERFSLQGSERAALRKAYDRVLAEGVSFEIVGSAKVPALIPELKRVSEEWLVHTKTSEKSFSRGYFDPAYVANFPCAVVRKDKRIVAFAILWVSARKEELALDLVCYRPDAPASIMEFMVTELMLGGRTRAYRWFNLGMVPIAGLEGHALAPLWQRIGRMIYRQSEHFRDHENYRRFAEQLGPVWRPKYLALPGGPRTPRILRDIGSLITDAKV
ncbi:MAG: bifunctional lysylphosphatidylglycerol flippase/synthetase MprF [Pseudomonadota bacterium]|nr:bifunctional lysylphosphatidylglycerol flippase/synthetase MprF [Pseudomonadota bacterium]